MSSEQVNQGVSNIRRRIHEYLRKSAQKTALSTESLPIPDFKLDPFQQKVVDSSGAFLRILAPAGAGKTRTLTAKAIDLLQRRPNARILCLTFTNAAADEFRQRIAESLEFGDSRIRISTLNSFGWELVRQNDRRAQITTAHGERCSWLFSHFKKLKPTFQFLEKIPSSSYRDIVEAVDFTKTVGFCHTDDFNTVAEKLDVLREQRISRVLAEKLKDLNVGDFSAYIDLENSQKEIREVKEALAQLPPLSRSTSSLLTEGSTPLPKSKAVGRAAWGEAVRRVDALTARLAADSGFAVRLSLVKRFEAATKANKRAMASLLRQVSLAPSANEDDAFSRLFHRAFLDVWFPFWQAITKGWRENSIYTLEDQKYWSLQFLLEDDKARKNFSDQGFTHILVDEFQDINYLDLLLILEMQKLANAHLYIVGDDDQCIYEWRGCRAEYLRDIDSLTGESFETVILERNYRCPKNIVAMASTLIAKNKNRIQKKITSVSTKLASVQVFNFPNAFAEMTYVSHLVQDLCAKEKSATVAIISRQKSQLIPIQILLAKAGVSFCVEDDLNVFASQAFDDFVDVLYRRSQLDTVLPCSKNVEFLFLFLDKLYSHPLSKDDRDAVTRHVTRESPQTLSEAVRAFATFPDPLKRGAAYPTILASHIKKLFESATVLDALRCLGDNFKGFQKNFAKARDDIFFKDPPFTYLNDLAIHYDDDFDGFLSDLRVAAAMGRNRTQGPAAIELMTVLRAKGREFHTVLFLDVNDGIWPHERSRRAGYIEEERRLFYVGVTRARQNLFFCITNLIDGKGFTASPFLDELGISKDSVVHWKELAKDFQDLNSQVFL